MEKISFNEILKSGLTRQEKARQIADKEIPLIQKIFLGWTL